ncbi:MAG: hypothetical protein H6Q19_878 [Bacteroidetes bacterium]|nr:hypothetical protein [Bacteroidota bacterium]
MCPFFSFIEFELSATGYYLVAVIYKVFDQLFTNAILFTLNDDCSAVILNNLFRMTLALASLLTSITIRIPSRLVSSLIFDIPSILFSVTRLAMYLISSDLLTL